MADIPSVKPTAPTTPAASNTPQLSNVPVQQAPETVTTPAQLTGTVVSSNPQTQQLNIQTAQGQVVVQSTVALPPNTPVTLELTTVNGQLRATVTVIKQSVAQTQADMTQTLENAVQTNPQTAPAPPDLQEGSTVTALQLPGETAMPAAMPAESFSDTPVSSMASPPLPNHAGLLTPPGIPQEAGGGGMPIAEKIQATTPSSPSPTQWDQRPPQGSLMAGERVSIPDQPPAEKNPGILRQLLSAYLPQKSAQTANVPAPAENTVPETIDNNLIHIMQAQLLAKTAQQGIQSPPAPGNTKQAAFSPLTTALDTLISSSGEASQKTSGFTALLRQLILQNAPAESSPAPQNMFQLHILRILPPQTTPEQLNTTLQKMPAAAQTGEVETATAGGQPILKTAEGHFVLTTPANAPTGSKIIFQATPMTPEEIVRQGLFTLPDDSSPQNSSWPALQDALKTLSSTNPQTAAAAQSVRNTLPTPTPQLAPTALFFLAALRSGSISNWLGANTLQALQQAGAKGLADALSSDFDKLSAQSRDVLPGDWRSISIPLRYDEQISQMQFYVRRQNDDSGQQKGQGDGKPATRFILNLSLSRMGPVQLDGFIQKKNFDIILRTEDRLPFDMRQELMKRFAQGLDQVQMQGGISFQTRQQGWMVPESGNVGAEA